MNQATRAEKLIELWDAYFAAPKKDKAPIMVEYNDMADEYNTVAKFKCMTTINASTKDSVKTKPVLEPLMVECEQVKKEPGGDKIKQILELHKAGKTNAEIVAAGFNKSTVARQVSEYKKRTK